VPAYLLKQQGYEVIGLFMRTGVHDEDSATPAHKKGCCSAVDAGDARRVADRLDIRFMRSILSAISIASSNTSRRIPGRRTPNPCVVCNNWLKFGKAGS